MVDERDDKPAYEQKLRQVLGDVEKEAYQRGWRDGIAAVIEAARVVMERQSRPGQAGGSTRRAKRGSVPSLVVRFLEERGNATTAELIEYAQVFEGAASSSVRTALRRLANDGKIRHLGDKWCLLDTSQSQRNNSAHTDETVILSRMNSGESKNEGEDDDDIP